MYRSEGLAANMQVHRQYSIACCEVPTCSGRQPVASCKWPFGTSSSNSFHHRAGVEYLQPAASCCRSFFDVPVSLRQWAAHACSAWQQCAVCPHLPEFHHHAGFDDTARHAGGCVADAARAHCITSRYTSHAWAAAWQQSSSCPASTPSSAGLARCKRRSTWHAFHASA